MTPQELKVLETTRDIWNEFIELPIQHQEDQNEFRFHIHALQNIILAREGQRHMKNNNSQKPLFPEDRIEKYNQ